MFIPRTLAEREDAVTRSGAGRALAVIAMVAAALFLVLSANITLGQENLEVGQIAPRDIRAQRDQTFTSVSRTETARAAAEDDVTPVTETVKSPTDNQEDQLLAFDTLSRRVIRILELRDSGSIDDADVLSRLANDAEEIPFAQRAAVAAMSVQRWNAVSEAGRIALGTTLADPIREDDLFATRSEVHDLVTTDLEGAERELAGDLAAALVAPTEVTDEALTQQAIDQARAEVPAVEVTVLAGQRIVNEGDPITIEQFETLDALGLTRPLVEVGTVVGQAIVALLIASLLVGYLWRFEPEIWYRNRSVLLFFLAFVVSAVAMRIAADRTLLAFVVPTTATVLLLGILLPGAAGAVMAVALAILAGVMNRDALELTVYVLVGGLASLLAITRAERINAFVRVFFVVAAAQVAVVVAFGALEQRDLAAQAQLVGVAVLNAAVSVALAAGTFAVLGNVFGIMTVFQML